MSRLYEFLHNISKQTSVHGLHLLGLPKLHIFERIFWCLMVTCAIIGAIEIGYSNWRHYLASPTVVSLQKDFRNWENPFPAATGCFMNKADSRKTNNYILSKWGVNSSHEKYEYYVKFVKTVSNISYANMKNFEEFENDNDLANVDMLDLALQVHPKLSGTLVTFDTKNPRVWSLIVTEMGLCFTVNSKFSHLFALKY